MQEKEGLVEKKCYFRRFKEGEFQKSIINKFGNKIMINIQKEKMKMQREVYGSVEK